MVDIFQRPAEQPSTLQRIGRGLQGFGAGVQGRGPQFLAGQRQEERTLSKERLQAAAEDLRRARRLLDAGNLQGVRDLAQERVGMIQELGGDPGDTQGLLSLADAAIAGDRNAFNALNAQVDAGLQSAADRGIIKLREAREDKFIDIQGGKALFQTPGGEVEAREIKGLSVSDLKTTKTVQSSKILPGGVTQITFKDGTTEVRKVSGEELRIVKDAEDRGVTLAQASSAARATGSAEARRTQKTINEGVEAVQGIPILRRGLQLLERVETGGIDAVRLRAKELFGIEGADEGELSANLGRAVLGQLRETFGAAFTEREGARLERMSAGFGKSPVSNKRLLRQALVLIQGASDRGLRAAGRAGDDSAIEQILDFQEGRFDLTDEALSNVFNPSAVIPAPTPTPGQPTPAPGQNIIRFDAQGNRIDG